MRWLAQCALSPRWGSCHPPLLLVRPVAHTMSRSHHRAHTRSCSPEPSKACSTGHTAVPSPPSGRTCAAWLFHRAALHSQSSTLLWGVAVFHLPQLCQAGGKNGKKKKIWIVTMRERFSSFLSAGLGNWTSNARRGFCSSLPLSLCCRVPHWRELVGWQGWHTIESPTNPGSSPTILEAESAVISYS